MKLFELIEELTDCHDKERLKNLKAEIERFATDYIMWCYDYADPDFRNGVSKR